MDHTEPQLLSQSVYGLSEFYKNELAKTKLISNPGCYATIILFSILPIADYINNSKISYRCKIRYFRCWKKIS